LNGGTPELSYHAIPPPKLDVVVVNKSLCRFECCAVVSKIKNYRFHEMTVAANHVCAIVGLTQVQAGSTTELSVLDFAEDGAMMRKPIAEPQRPSVR
jgi:hypothetical protein